MTNPHDFVPMPQNPNFCAYYGCNVDKVNHRKAEPRYRQWTVRGRKPPFQVCDPYGNFIATVHTTIESAEGIATAMNNRTWNTPAKIREAIFTALDAGDPERGGDPWALDAVMSVTFDDATENRYRFVSQVVERLMEAK
jgi:hypothetical protein